VSYVLNAVTGFLAIAEPALISAGVVALPFGANALLRAIRVRKLMPIIRRAFVILDPLLNEQIKNYRGSDVRFAIGLVTEVLADGALSQAEVKQAIEEIERRWRPSLAAGKSPEQLPAHSRDKRVLEAVTQVVGKAENYTATLSDAAQLVRGFLQ
jgi:hypothetical protein